MTLHRLLYNVSVKTLTRYWRREASAAIQWMVSSSLVTVQQSTETIDWTLTGRSVYTHAVNCMVHGPQQGQPPTLLRAWVKDHSPPLIGFSNQNGHLCPEKLVKLKIVKNVLCTHLATKKEKLRCGLYCTLHKPSWNTQRHMFDLESIFSKRACTTVLETKSGWTQLKGPQDDTQAPLYWAAGPFWNQSVEGMRNALISSCGY